jgi:cell wall-associated NlpC family hydrolase
MALNAPFIRFALLAVLLLAAGTLTGCASATGAVPRPFPVPGGSAGASPATPSFAPALLETALQLRGSPYRNGGSAPDGFDCSGFTQYVFARHDLHLPRETRDQFRVGESIRRKEVAPGDLLFFTTSAPGASHVAIAVNDDEFVHAPSSTGVVRIERLSSTYWSRRFLGARRITPP